MDQDLLGLCEKYKNSVVSEVVIEEPYIPYIPPDWNRLLVLAASQNLSLSNEEYVKALRNLESKNRMKRLGHPKLVHEGEIGVLPWDDGSLKLAIEAAFGVVATRTAVSNAVPWSQRDPNNSKKNINPDSNLQSSSSDLWREMLDILNPELVICSGNIAWEVIRKADWNEKYIKKLRLPSPTAMNRISGMFDKDDLLSRYPEVKKILGIHPQCGDINKILFACHAVSLYGDNMRNRSS